MRPQGLDLSFVLLLSVTAGCGSDHTAPSGPPTSPSEFTPTYSTTTPALNDTVTMTVPGFSFLPDATVSTGRRPAVVVGRSAAGTTLSFVPVPGATNGAVSVNGVVRSSEPGVPLELVATRGITPPAGAAGAGAFATAPSIGVPATGKTTYFLDAGPFSSVPECVVDLTGPCRVYKFTVAAAQRLGLTVTWEGASDLGVYIYDADRNLTGIMTCDSKGFGVDGQPESCSGTFPPGTYFFAVESFATLFGLPDLDPLDIRLVLTGLP